MAVFHEKYVEGVGFDNPAAKAVLKKALVSPKEGWEGTVMRVFEIEEGGYSPKHQHPWYHVNYVVSGNGILHYDGKDYEVEEGSYAYIPENVVHQFKSAGKGPLKFICIVPEEGDK